MNYRHALGGAAALVTVAVSLGAPSAQAGHSQSPAPRQIYLVQGVPGVSVNVAIDGEAVGKSLEAKAIAGPLDITPGSHVVRFSTNDWTISSRVRINSASSDIVLHWPADVARRPEVTVFANNVEAVARSKARLTLAHTAAVPPVDLRVDDKVLFSNIANGEFLTSDVPAGAYSVELVPTGQLSHPLLGPLKVPVQTEALTRVFAIGQPRNGSMAALVQVIPLAHKGSAPPATVDAGTAGLADPSLQSGSASASGWILALTGVGGLGALTCFAAAVRRRA